MLDFYLLIPYYNNCSGLVRSLESIQYDKEKYKIVIVDDGSNEPLSLNALPASVKENQPIQILRLPENKGITVALNTGLHYIMQHNDALFIARLDCGDICSPERFYTQVNTLKENPQLYLLGSWCIFKDFRNGGSYLYKSKTQYEDILREMHWKCSFIHPSVMFRVDTVKVIGLYPGNFPHAEDYAYFFKICRKYPVQILPHPHTVCEIRDAGLSVRHRKEQYLSKIKVIREFGTYKLLTIIGIVRFTLLQILPVILIKKIKKNFFV